MNGSNGSGAPVDAAADPRAADVRTIVAPGDADQVELLRCALTIAQQQLADANAQALQRMANLAVQLAAAHRRINELEATKVKAD
jgi:hypothetical protein